MVRKFVTIEVIKEMIGRSAPAPENVPQNLIIVASEYYNLINKIVKEYNLKVRMTDKWAKAGIVLEGEAYEADEGTTPAQFVYFMCENHASHHLVLIFFRFKEGFSDPYSTIMDANTKLPIFNPKEVEEGLVVTYAFYLDLLNYTRPGIVSIFLPSDKIPYYSIGIVTPEGGRQIPIASSDGLIDISVDEWREVQARSLYGTI